jgi:hypothetical protein
VIEILKLITETQNQKCNCAYWHHNWPSSILWSSHIAWATSSIITGLNESWQLVENIEYNMKSVTVLTFSLAPSKLLSSVWPAWPLIPFFLHNHSGYEPDLYQVLYLTTLYYLALSFTQPITLVLDSIFSSQSALVPIIDTISSRFK